jgi:hypothetical protein
MEKTRGYYAGTEVAGRWWWPYAKVPFFARGNGEYWYDEQSFQFRRYLTQNPLVIPFRCVSEVQVGRWHAGRWAWGAPMVKLIWEHDGRSLSSGFVLSRNESQARQVLEEIERRLSLSTA